VPRNPKNLRKRGGVWWYRITKNGKTFEDSLQTGDVGVAKERLEGVRRELTATKFGEKPRRTFDEAARRFKAEHFPTLRYKSRLRYSVSLRAMVDHFQGVYLDEIGSAKMGDFERARLAAGVTTTTVRRDLACLSSLFSRAEEWEWVTNNPVKPYKRGRARAGLKEGNPRTRYLSGVEETAVLPRTAAKAAKAVAFAIDTGLRKEEQFSLELTDIDFEARHVTVRAEVAKTGVERKVPLLDRAYSIAVELAAGRVGRVPLFVTKDGKRYSPESPTMYEALQKACRRAGVAPVSWHDLRRTCGCRLLQDHGLSIQEVSAWLGHGDVRITQQRYAFLKIDQLQRALKRPSNVVHFPRKGQSNGQSGGELE